jgi:hypothetical protein
MPAILHILTKPDDVLAQAVIAEQQHQGEANVEVVDLTRPAPDYETLVEKIFSADSVEVW